MLNHKTILILIISITVSSFPWSRFHISISNLLTLLAYISISEYSISFQKKGRNEYPNKCINEETIESTNKTAKVLSFFPFWTYFFISLFHSFFYILLSLCKPLWQGSRILPETRRDWFMFSKTMIKNVHRHIFKSHVFKDR